MFEIGRVCLKLAGRDGGREAVIVDVLDEKQVLVDGNVRRRKCNIMHLEPTSKKIDIKKGATHEQVKKEFEKIGLGVWETKKKEKTEKPKKQRKQKEKKVEKPEVKKDAKDVKKEAKKEKPKKPTKKTVKKEE
jgi:large subunit ribosomal protein L14e